MHEGLMQMLQQKQETGFEIPITMVRLWKQWYECVLHKENSRVVGYGVFTMVIL
jgi:hypothetical protein